MIKEYLIRIKFILSKLITHFEHLPKKQKWIASISSVFLILMLILFIFWSIIGSSVGDGKQKYQFSIEAGDGSIKVTRELKKLNLIKSPSYFHFLLYIHGNTKKIKQGIYSLDNGMNAKKIMDIIVYNVSKYDRLFKVNSLILKAIRTLDTIKY